MSFIVYSEMDLIRSGCKTLRERAIVEFLVSSGVRITELCNLNISDVNFHTLEVIVQHGKGNKFRKTFINDIAAAHLKKYLASRKDSDVHLFSNRYNKRISKNASEKELHKIGDRVGLTNVHPHRFRRTMATEMYKRGIDIHTIQILLGHTKLDTTMRYIQTSTETTRQKYRMAMC